MALNWKYRGFDYVSYYRGGYANADSMAALAATGANSAETSLEWGIDPLTDTVYADSNYTDPLSAEAAMIREGVADGLQVMVKPVIDFLNPAYLKGTPYSVGDWRTYYNPGAAGSAGANAFFASYKTMLLQEAQVAVANGATMLCIGTELDQIAGPAYKSYWDDIISTLRAQDPSLKLTYAADWNDALSPWQWGGSGLPKGTGNIATQISFAGELDYLGLDVYAPLSNAANPTLSQLVAGWTQTPVDSGATAETYAVTGNQSLIQYFEGVAAAVGKPLLFTEVGFDNASDAASSPAGTATGVENDALQALAYQAFFQAFSQSNDASLAGAFLYNWDPNAAEVGPGSVAFSPQNLPALNVIKSYFAAPSLSAPASVGSGLDIAVAVPGVALGANSTGSVFTVTLSDSGGALSATGPASVTGSGTASLTVTGALAAVDATLATLQYEATQAGADTLHISASADGGPASSAKVALAYDAAFPVLSFAYANPVSGATINLSGNVNAANAGGTVRFLVNGVAAASATAGAKGAFAANLTLPIGMVDVVTAQLTDAAGDTGSTPPLMIGVSDGLTATLGGAGGNVVNVFNATSSGDTVNGSDGYVIVHGSKVTVNGGGDQIYTDGSTLDSVKLTGTNGVADFLSASNATVELDNAQVRLQGGADKVTVASGASNSLAGSGGSAVNVAAGATLRLAGASAYAVTASQAHLTLAANSKANLTGSLDSVVLATGAQLDLLSGAKDAIYAGLTDSLVDAGSGTLVKIRAAVGTLAIADFAADATGVIELLNGVGGFASAAAAAAALTSDGSGGALLSLGAAGAIDFEGVAPSALGAARFKIG
jgi:hypothetical protein